MPQSSSWDPDQYNRFAAEREQPFWDLATLIEPINQPDVVDLGCGDGRLTRELHRLLGARSTVGVDSAASMLERSREYAGDGVRFEQATISQWSGELVDVVFANAALQWIPRHLEVLTRWCSALREGGQLAIQVPANADHPSHLVAAEVAAEMLGDGAPPDPVAANVLPPQRYAEFLNEFGFERQHVRLQVYGHRLASTAEVIEWAKGTSLTRFRAVLDTERYASLLAEYRRRLLDTLGDRAPYFYLFKRILFWGRLPGG